MKAQAQSAQKEQAEAQAYLVEEEKPVQAAFHLRLVLTPSHIPICNSQKKYKIQNDANYKTNICII